MVTRHCSLIVGSGLNLILWSAAPCQSQEMQVAKNVITLDGRVTAQEWNDIDTLSFISHWPAYSHTPTTRTQYRIAYDEKFLYFSAVCFDNTALIQGPYFERDNWGMTMDQVALFLDTYNDNENGLVFAVTPTGSRIDAAIRNDAQGLEPADLSWNSFWEAKVSLLDSGWSVEARIPFSSLRFQPVNGKVTMGLIAYRYIARERQMDIFPDVPPDWGFWSFVKPSRAADVSFHDLQNKRPWFTSPFLVSRLGYHHIRSVEPPGLVKQNDRDLEAGLDVQHALTDNMNLDITLNTDFAQVEADDQVVNLSRFSFFFPEKRRFFLERSSIMDFGFENDNRLFYSRRIGINDGAIVPLWGGARLVGRVGNYDVGMLSMQSRGIDESPSENFGVFRLRRRVSKNNSYVGGIFTSRTGGRGGINLAYGVDGIINLHKNDYLKLNLAQTYESTDTSDYNNSLAGRNRIYLMWENRSQVGLNYSVSYSQVDAGYAPGLGFETRNNFKSFGDRVSYGWFPKKNSSVRYMKFDLRATAFYPNTTNTLESFMLAPSFLVEWVKYSSLQITFNRFYDNIASSFKLSDEVVVSPGTYVNNDITLNFETPPVNFLTSIFTLTSGTFYNGDRFSGGVTPIYTISKYLTLSGFYQYNKISFSDKPDYVAHVGRFKVATSLNVKLSVNAFAQINTLTKVTAVNFRLRYNWKDGNDLFVVYNETLNNDGRVDPELPFSDYRAFIVKYIYTFHLGR